MTKRFPNSNRSANRRVPDDADDAPRDLVHLECHGHEHEEHPRPQQEPPAGDGQDQEDDGDGVDGHQDDGLLEEEGEDGVADLHALVQHAGVEGEDDQGGDLEEEIKVFNIQEERPSRVREK